MARFRFLLSLLLALIITAVSTVLVLQVAEALTAALRPNADGGSSQSTATTCGGAGNFDCVNDVVTQPTSPLTNVDFLLFGNNNTDFYLLETTTAFTTTSVTIWVYHLETKTNMQFQIGLYAADESTQYGTTQNVTTVTGLPGWSSVTVSGLNLTQTQLDDLRVRVQCAKSGGGGPGQCTLYALYTDITYSNPQNTISGTVYTDEGTTNIGSAKTVVLHQNGAAVGTAETNSSGQFSITYPQLTGAILTLFLDNETEQATTVTISNGQLMTGVDLYQNHLIVRNESTGNITNTTLDTADNGADTDILFSVAGGVLTVSNNVELYIWSGDTFVPGGAVSTHDLQTIGTMTMGLNALTISGSADVSAGTFTTASLVTFTSAGSETFKPGSVVFSGVTFSGGGTYTLASSFDVNGNLQIVSGNLDVSTSNYAMNVAGNWSNASTFTARSGTVTFDGTSQTVSGSTTFHNFTKTVLTADTFTLYSTKTQTVLGALTLRGAVGQLLTLRSDVSGIQAILSLDAGGSQLIDYVDVADNDATGGQELECLTSSEGCVNSGNTDNWFFGAANNRSYFYIID